ncbi:MAG: hypothetical protein LBE35_07660 [Clostridiales bacterium]|nr:hypothetical protein [Clostridiales bacterium]
MFYYLQRKRNVGDIVLDGSIINFDTAVSVSQTPGISPAEDFDCPGDGSIHIRRPGIYFIFWNITQMTGIMGSRPQYSIKKFDGLQWLPFASAGGHYAICPLTGFCTLIASEAEIDLHGEIIIALFNSSGADVVLTDSAHEKASILISGVNAEALENRLHNIETFMMDLYEHITTIENALRPSEIIYIDSIPIPNIRVAVTHIGNVYEFWGVGTLASAQTFANGQTYWLITGDQYPPLAGHTGDAAISTLWIEAPGGNMYSMPIRMDNRGIFFVPQNQLNNLPAGTTFKFNKSLIITQ